MSSDPDAAADGPGGEARTWTSRDLAALDDLVSRVRDHPDARAELALEVELETAHEELRVADEEIRVQRQQLAELLTLRHGSTLQRRRVASLLPLPMLTTDRAGRVKDANAAAAAQLNVPLVRLLGKPLISFVHDGDRTVARQALSAAEPEPAAIHLHLAPRRSEPVAVDVVLTAEPTAPPGAEPDTGTATGPGAVESDVEWTILIPGPPEPTAGPRVDPLRLAAAVARLSRLPVGETEPRALLTGIARTTSDALGDAVSVSANLGSPSEPTEVASTSEEAAVADGLQLRTGEGPAHDAFGSGETVVVDDLRRDPRWPRLVSVWGDAPVASAVAVPIVAQGRTVGVLTCYGSTAGAVGEPEAQAAEILALAAGAAFETIEETSHLRRLAGQLDHALASRAVIDQAIGIVMAHRACTADEAFRHLAALSQQRNVKLRDVARALVERSSEGGSTVSRRRS